VPLVQRTLQPLCYERQNDILVPRTPDQILGLKIGEPAMGSGSFLAGALRYLVEALVASLDYHQHIQPRGERETIVTLPFGTSATGDENEEVFDLPPEDDRFLARLRPRLARHVVERCLYGVDINPMAVELARLALWVETLDRELPFEYLDHKLKCGNSLVGCWLHLVDDYPLRALEREGGDGPKGGRTKWLKGKLAQAKQEMPDVIRALGGAITLFD
jgi:type II restriction/modification system DNA methylase subunit YeeA